MTALSPAVAQYEPAEHAPHELCLDVAWKNPWAQSLQAAPPAVNMPAEQSEQSVEAVSPANDAFPPAQSMQDDWPVFSWYLPAAQSMQLETAPAEIFPASQLVQADADAAEYSP